MKAIAEKQTKERIVLTISEDTGVPRKEVAAETAKRHLTKKGSGQFVISEVGVKLKRMIRPATKGTLATAGPYAYVRHPQYAAFIVIMVGFLLQWPTLMTLGMFPVLVTVYVRLARCEEHEVRAEFGQARDDYAARTPAFFPFVRRRAGAVGEEMGCVRRPGGPQ